MMNEITLTLTANGKRLVPDVLPAAGTWETPEGVLSLSRRTTVTDGGRLTVTTRLVNRTDNVLHPQDVPFTGTLRIRNGRQLFSHAYVECLAMLGACGPQRLEPGCTYESYGLIGLTDADGRAAWLCGMTRTDDHFYRFTVSY